ncbi:MAG TPA: hypothetical protein DCY89_03070 [Gammaproteobacteria bacterium]|nr:hypothetical protein [Gammaproteobacteria bacterium]
MAHPQSIVSPTAATTTPVASQASADTQTHSRRNGFIGHPGLIFIGAITLMLLHGSLRLGFTSAIEVDQAEQLVLAQRLQVFYGTRQPPLYTWLAWLLEQPFGPARELASGLKYLLFVAAGTTYWLAARSLGATRREAGLCIVSLVLLYQIVWKMHQGVTHSALLCLASAATLLTIARLRDQHRRRDYLLAACAIVIGMLSKHSYWAFLVALLAAAVADPGLRRRLTAPCSGWLWVPIAGLGVTYLTGLLLLPDPLAVQFRATLGASDATRGFFESRLQGLGSLIQATAGFLSFLLLPMLAAPWLRGAPGTTVDSPLRSAGRQLLFRLNVGLLVLLLGLVLVGGATHFVERWLHAFLLWLPMAWVFTQAQRGRLEAGRALPRLMLALAGLLIAAALTWQAVQDIHGPPACHRCRPLIDHGPLADALAEARLADADLLAGDEHIAANLRLRLPGIAVRVPNYPQLQLPRRADRPCVLVWDLGRGVAPPGALLSLAREWCGEGLTAAVQAVTVPLQRQRARHAGWTRTLAAPFADAAYGFAFARYESLAVPPVAAPRSSPPGGPSASSASTSSDRPDMLEARRERPYQAGADSRMSATMMRTMPIPSERVGTSPNCNQPASRAMTGFAREASEASLAESRSRTKVHSSQPSALPPMAVKAKAQRNSGVQSVAGPGSMTARSTSRGVP